MPVMPEFEQSEEVIAGKIVIALTRRSGFDNAWDGCDADTQSDILAELTALVRSARTLVPHGG